MRLDASLWKSPGGENYEDDRMGAYINAFAVVLGAAQTGGGVIVRAGSIVMRNAPPNSKYANDIKDRYLE